MKNRNRIFLLLVCVSLFSACETSKVENASPNLNKTENIQNTNSNFAVNANTPPANNSKSNDEANSADTADFTGTAGITDKKNNVKAAALLRDVRTAQHANFDRVVFEFEGAEMPSYHIEYVDKPVRACGSGDVVPLPGDGWLEIRFSTANAHTEEGKATVEKREQAPNHKIIKELKLTCDFEAEVEWVLGVASPNKYRVLELKNPTRLAVDIKH